MEKFKLIQLLNKVELAVGETVMSEKVKENINGLILDVKNEAINFIPCCTELKIKECPMCNEEKDCQGHNVCEDCGGRSF